MSMLSESWTDALSAWIISVRAWVGTAWRAYRGNGDKIGTALGQYNQSVKRDSSSFFLASQEPPVFLQSPVGLGRCNARLLSLPGFGPFRFNRIQRHATINLKLGSAHFPREKEITRCPDRRCAGADTLGRVVAGELEWWTCADSGAESRLA